MSAQPATTKNAALAILADLERGEQQRGKLREDLRLQHAQVYATLAMTDALRAIAKELADANRIASHKR